jgi:hypothetical protein
MVPTIVIQSEEEFIKRKSIQYGVTVEQFHMIYRVEPCDCLSKHCEGWITLPKIMKED